jgi:hypothetical protein
VIKVRYSDLPAGLHASASSEGRHTVIYLVPGLSAADRQGAIDRLRASARVGHGPKLPAVSLALALIADRIRLNLRNAAAAARLHPIGAAIPVVVLGGGAILYALFVTVSIRLGPPPQPSAQAPLPLSAASAPASTGSAPGDSGGVADPTSATRLTRASSARRASLRDSTAREQVAGAHPAPSSPGPSPDPSVSSSSPPGHPSPPPPRSPSPSPSPTGSHGGGICLNLGILRICVHP